MNEGRRYRILGVLGKGGFGTVYRAELMGEGGFTRQVALKVLNKDMRGMEDVAARMRDEARLLGLLRHRAILQVDGLVRLNDRWTIVMEFIEGADLQKVVRQAGPVPLGPALEIIGEVASALHVAYTWPSESGAPMCLLHRDIKPPNILITAAGETKVLDFGIARAEFGGREALTRSVLYGSMGYMAPERLDFEELPEGDVYALGTVLYELLVGDGFGKASIHPDRHRKQVEEGIDLIRRKLGEWPSEAEDLLSAMLSYDPEERPNAREVERRCRTLRGQVPGEFLRDWAENVVPNLLLGIENLESDELSGSVLVEAATTSQVEAGDFDDTGPVDEENQTFAFGEEERAERARVAEAAEVADEAKPRSRGFLWATLGSMGCVGVAAVAGAVVVAVVVVVAVLWFATRGDDGMTPIAGGDDDDVVEFDPGSTGSGGKKASGFKDVPKVGELPPPEMESTVTMELVEPWDNLDLDVGAGNIVYCTEDSMGVQYGRIDVGKLSRYFADHFIRQHGYKKYMATNMGTTSSIMLKKKGQKKGLIISASETDQFNVVNLAFGDF